MLFHPTINALSRYADGDSPPREIRRIKRHLPRCQRCRDELRFMRDLGDSLRELPSPRPPDEIWDAIVGRLDAGDVVLLPDVDQPLESFAELPPMRPTRGRAPAAAAAAVIATLLITGSWEGASAGATSLTLSPFVEVDGELPPLIEIDYRTASLLAGEDSLRLRARVRAADSDEPRYVETILQKAGPGRFTGALVPPPGTVFGELAVEDMPGERIDARAGRHWNFVATTTAGDPTADALRQKILDTQEDVQRALDAARELTRLYPLEPSGWYFLDLLGEATTGELVQSDKLRDLHDIWSRDSPTPEQARELHRYALFVGRPELAAKWLQHLEANWPDSPETTSALIADARLRATRGLTIDEQLHELDGRWRSGAEDSALAWEGLRVATRGKDVAAARTWAGRLATLSPDDLSPAATLLSTFNGTGKFVAEHLRHSLRAIHAGYRGRSLTRRLNETATNFQSRIGDRQADLLFALGEELVESGSIQAGLDTLRLASDFGWSPARFRRLGQVRLAAGDSIGALRMFARVSADPIVDLDTHVSSAIVRSEAEQELWRRLLGDAREEFEEKVGGWLTHEPLSTSLRATVPFGDRTAFASLLHKERPTLVLYLAFVHTDVEPFSADLRRLRPLLLRRGIQPIVVTSHESKGALLEKLTLLGDLPVYVDDDWTLARALSISRSTGFAVVSREAALIWSGDSIESGLRVMALGG